MASKRTAAPAFLPNPFSSASLIPPKQAKVVKANKIKRTDNYQREVEGVTTGVLEVEGHKLYVIKELLGFVSPVFKTMFTGDFKKKQMKEHPLPGKKFQHMVWMLDFLYPGIPFTLTDEKAVELLKLAEEYQIKPLRQACVDVLMKQEKPRLELVTLASTCMYNIPELLEISINSCVRKVDSKDLEEQRLHPENKLLDLKHLVTILRRKLDEKAKEHADCTPKPKPSTGFSFGSSTSNSVPQSTSTCTW